MVSSRGVVVTAASHHIGGLKLALARLRSLEVHLLVEVWLEPGLDPGDDWANGVSFRHFTSPCDIGFARKIEALLSSAWSEVLFLDADVWFLVNPEEWFESEQFQEHGYLLWPDLPRTNSVGWPPTDSGVMLWDLDRHRSWLHCAMQVTLSEHSGRAEGDKESYALAQGQPVQHAAQYPDFAGFVEMEQVASMVRGCAMLQYWQDRPAFLHSTLFKFGVHECLHEPPHWPFQFPSEGHWVHAFSGTYGRWFPSVCLSQAIPLKFP